MSLVKKGLSQPTIKKPSPLHSSDSAFNVLKFTNRPNTTTGTIGNPTYLNKVYSRDKPNNSLKGSPKLPSSPTNAHSKFKRPDSNTVTEVSSPNKLRPDKKHYSDKDQLTLKQKTKSANKAGSRYNAQGNMNSQDVIDLSYCDPKSIFRQKGKQSATSSRKLLHEDLKDRSLLSELSMGWAKSVSYGIADVETPASTRKVLKPIEQKNKKPAPILIVNCELDLKGEKEKAKETKKEIESVKTPVNTRKRKDKEASSKKTSPNKDIQSLNVSKQVSPTKIIQKTQKSEVKAKGKENKENKSAVKKVKEKEEKTPTLKSTKLVSKKSPKKEPISKPSTQLKEPTESKEVSMEVQEPKSLTNISRINLETSLDTSILSSSFMKDIRPSTAKLPGSMNSLTSLNSIASTKSYFASKAMNTKPRQTSPSTKTSPSLGIETNPNTEESLNIQPSKNSEFSFKMTFFKPIEDHTLDKYIREINQSQSLKKKLGTAATITSTNNITIKKDPETFCPPLPSSQALETQRPVNGELSKQNSIILEEPIQAHHKKSFSTAKKVPSIQTKNSNNLALKSSVQDLSVKAQKVLDSHPKGGRESLEEIAKDFNKPGSPLAKEKYAITLAERVVRDEKIKLEAKAKNNFSKLDRILQEMKENPSISMTDENIAPHLGDGDGGLFNQGSRVESSSSTNCSLNRSFANTLRKIAVSHSEY